MTTEDEMKDGEACYLLKVKACESVNNHTIEENENNMKIEIESKPIQRDCVDLV
jgi:hypothetical protein